MNSPDIFTGELEHVGCRYGWILYPQEPAVIRELTPDAGTEQFLPAAPMAALAAIIRSQYIDSVLNNFLTSSAKSTEGIEAIGQGRVSS